MATDVVMPKMGESITEGTVLRWLKKEGDAVAKDEPILEISTDKVDTEVPSPVAGTLLKMLVQENETVGVGTPVATIGEKGDQAAASNRQSAPAAQPAPELPKPEAPKQEAPKQTTPQQDAPAQNAAPQDSSPAQNEAPPAEQNSGGEGQAVVMPKMGESITEGTVLRWLKKAGDSVKKDEPIVEISTDKVDTEVPAPFAGTLSKIVAQEKETIAVGATLAFISSGAVKPAAAAPSAAKQPAQSQDAAPKPATPEPTAPQSSQQQAAPVTRGTGDRFYSPLVRSIAKEENISQQELDALQGSGLEGRVNKTDILAYVESRKSGKVAALQQSQPAAPAKTAQPAAKPVSYPLPAAGLYTAIPMDNIRQRIAEHMVRSVHTSAHVTSVAEVDVTNIVNFRNKFKEEFKSRNGLNLTYTPIFIEAMVKAIRDFPIINSSVEGTEIIVKKEINFGVAVSLPQVEGSPLPPALIVPVIKRADELNLAGLARAVSDLAARARSKKLTPDDISGGTFTFTNPGIFGNLFGTPIINQPQVAIMTTGAIVKRVVVKTDESGNDTMAIRSMMYLGLSYDHRVIDGNYGVKFTDAVRKYLEEFSGENI
jgi:pyruvate dehydrogenase E2 component (dihydrolipoamide acetyltransferase)